MTPQVTWGSHADDSSPPSYARHSRCPQKPLPAPGVGLLVFAPSQGGPHRSGWKAGLGSSLPHLLTVGSLAACFSLPWCKETTESVLGAMKLSKTRGGPQNSCQATVFCAGLSLQGLWVHGPSRFWVSGSISTSTNLRHLTRSLYPASASPLGLVSRHRTWSPTVPLPPA